MLDTEQINKIAIGANFDLNEFECPCCRMVRIHPALLDRLETLRDRIGMPIFIKSGFRCTRHNQDVGGKHGGYHPPGMAADVEIPGLVPSDGGQAARDAGFTCVIVYPIKGVIHLDVRPGEPYYNFAAN